MKGTRRRFGFGLELFAVQVAVITAVVTLFTGVAVAAQAALVRDDNEEQIRSLAQTIAALPTVVDGLQSSDPVGHIHPVMVALQEASGVDYITIVDLRNLRVSHPDPSLIGLPPSTDHTAVRAGEEYAGVEAGTLGPTFRVKLPVVSDDGRVLGTVSVGVLESRLTADVVARAWQLIGVAGGALVLGTALSWVVTRGIRRRLYGVDPRALRTLLQTRDSMLAGVSDGFIAVDAEGRIALANAAATSIIGTGDLVGDDAATRLPGGLARLSRLDAEPVDDETAQRTQLELDGRSIVVTRSNARIGGRASGVTLLLQDRTELERAMHALDAQTARADAMRRETHEFDNRLHVISGLLALGEVEEASRLLAAFPASSRPGVRAELNAIDSPALAALLESHMARAAGVGVRLSVADDTVVDQGCRIGPAEISIVGNLIDNAVEAAQSRVEVYLRGDLEGLACRVDDDGPGIPPGERDRIFTEGVSSKPATIAGRGIGLAVVADLVAQRHGSIDLDDAPAGGAAFEVWLPAEDSHDPPAPHARRTP